MTRPIDDPTPPDLDFTTSASPHESEAILRSWWSEQEESTP